MATGKRGEFAGKLLRVDLSTGRIWDEVVDAITMRKYVGGNGSGGEDSIRGSATGSGMV